MQPKISVAPMMDWTDRHCRYFHRLLAPHALLYTEMVTTGAILHGDKDRHLAYSGAEHPLALQLGGSDPDDLAACARIAAQYGYDEVNLNCGCPSDRVQKGRFGACLMNEPETVADCARAMIGASPLPVTIKCRIGVDACDEEPFLHHFVQTVYSAGVRTFIIHARKAWLKGLSPKENREVPPLRYDIAARIKDQFPDARFILNGGIKTAEQVLSALETFDGVMIGRAAYETPYILAEIEHALYGRALPGRADIVRAMIPYIEERRQADPGIPLNAITRHILNLYHGERGGRAFRRILTEGAQDKSAGPALILDALAAVAA